MAAIICVTVVLPLLPVTAMSGRLNCARHADASDPSASFAVVDFDPREARGQFSAMGDRRDGALGLGFGQEIIGIESARP
jgi:hypothetical protein